MYRHIVFLMTALLLSSLAGQVMAQEDPSLLGWWKLDEGQGTAAVDSSGNGNHGTIVRPNAGLGPGGSVWLDDSERGTVISFDGAATGAYVRAGTIPQMTLTNDFTWAFWAKQDAGNGANDIIFGNRMNENAADFSPRQFIKFTPTKLEWHQNANGNDNLDYADIPNGEWLHHAAVKTGSRLTYYRNGIMANSRTITQALDFPMPLFLGGDNENSAGENWRGMMGDARVYTRALTDAEIKAIGGQPKARKPNPADGALGVAMPLLQWTAGDSAMFHNVYIGTGPDLTDTDLKAPRHLVAMYYHVAGFTPGTTYYWRVDEIDQDGVTVHAGDVWTFTMQDVKAYHPAPADKANDASPSPTLTWMPGQGTVKHHVYFGASLDAVTQGTADTDKGELALTSATFAPGALDSLTTYHWRVDEILAGGTKTGPVWSFTTFLSVDDFEAYTDDEGKRIYETWVDGWTNGTGSQVGNTTAPFAEKGIVHGGLQSMPVDYNNVKTPFYSEAEREFAPTGDWTANGADTLILYVRGTPGNKPAPLYLTVEDASKRSATVTHADSGVVATSKWTEWKIPLSDLAGVNLAKVKKLYLGLGDKKAPVAGGAGRVYVDDIRVTKP